MIHTDNDIIIAAIAKNENEYIAEWVEYHFKRGFDKIVICDNNDIDGERIDDVPEIKKYIEEDKVEIINLRGFGMVQKQFYNYVIDNIDYKWCAFIDIDEFFAYGEKWKFSSIKTFLNAMERKGYRAIKCQWLKYGDNGLINKGEGGVVERFPNPGPLMHLNMSHFPDNAHCKSILHKDIKDHFTQHPHTVGYKKYILPDETNVDDSPYNVPFAYSMLYIKHYYTKSLEEWVEHKLHTGYADLPTDKKLTHPMSFYFMINDKTDDKLRYLEEHGIDYDK